PRLQALISTAALTGVFAASVALMVIADTSGPQVVNVGSWGAPVGIALVVDRLSALMLAVSALVLLGVLLYSPAQGIADGPAIGPRLQALISTAALTGVFAASVALMVIADTSGPQVVNVGSWGAPVGIALVVDRLSALMLAVSALVILGVLLYSLAQGIADGPEGAPLTIFHPTYLVLAAGVANAFISGDLFNIYVGFEILLAASFVLLTRGGTGERIRAGSIYVVVSLLSSVLFLVAIAMI